MERDDYADGPDPPAPPFPEWWEWFGTVLAVIIAVSIGALLGMLAAVTWPWKQ